MAETSMSEPRTAQARTQPPTWAPLLLGLALPIAVVLQLAALAVSAIVFPLFDLTPLWVLFVALLARRWDGVSKKWFTVPIVLALLLLVQWIAWDVWYYTVAYVGDLSTYGFDELVRRFGNPLVVLLLAQMVALLILFGRACVLSFKGVKRVLRRA